MTAVSESAAGPALRLDVDSDDVARGFAQVVLAVAELLRELLERQAIRRIDAGDLNEAQIERVGSTLLRIKDELEHLRSTVSRPNSERDMP